MIYVRRSDTAFFIWPAFAVGLEDGVPWCELAWLCWSVGVGEING